MDEETKYLKPFDFSVDIDTTEERDRLNGLIDKAFGTGFTMRWGISKGNKVGISGLHGWWDRAIPWGRHFKSIKDFKEHLLLLGYNGQSEPIKNFKEGEAEMSATPKTGTDADKTSNNGVRVGDWAVVTKRHSDNSAKEGMVGRLLKIDEGARIKYEIGENHNFKFSSSWCIDVRKATDDEIFKHLKKEAEHRGLWDNPDVECLFLGKKNTSRSLKPVYTKETDCLWSKYGRIYQKGRWANKIGQNDDDPLFVDLEQFPRPSAFVDSSDTTHYFYRTDWDLLGIDPEKFSGQQKPTKGNLVHQTPVGVQKKKQKKRRIKIV